MVAPWTDIDFSDTKPETDETNTMLPDPDVLSRGYASWLVWKTDSKFVAIKVEKSSSVKSTTGFLIFVPTLFIWTTK